MKEKQESSEFEQVEFVDERKISQMNHSFILCIPKKFVEDTRFDRITRVKIFREGKCLRIVASGAKNGDEEVEL